MLLVAFPVGDRCAGYTAFHSSLGYGCTHLCDKAWVYRFWNEVFRTEGQVVDVVNIVHHIWNRLLGQIGDGMYGSHLHLLVDGTCVNIERTTEDVWESDHVVDLVWIIAAAC